ncbi:MAG: hypothetical protein WCW04_03725, partial [Candidatus Paceibacterota bacterium]
KNRDSEELDMMSELFIQAVPKIELIPPPAAKEVYLERVNDRTADREDAIYALVHFARMDMGSAHSEAEAKSCLKKVVSLVRKCVDSDPSMGETAAIVFLKCGGMCEAVNYYYSALWLYEGSMLFESSDPNVRYFQHNNLGFCLNYFKQFAEAESYLVFATKILPHRYNAWKNLGVSLEHQACYREAAESYLRAITEGHAESRSAKHLFRLLDRHPELLKIPEIMAHIPAARA